MNTLIFRTVAPFLTALLVLFSIFILLRGHNEPGGGFTGGLIARFRGRFGFDELKDAASAPLSIGGEGGLRVQTRARRTLRARSGLC